MNIEQLIQEAIEASKNTYSPFSHYSVGAALLTVEGLVFHGTNIENDSYGLTICAERSAIFSAVSNGYRHFNEMAVVTKDGGTSCGACRQVIIQFASPDMKIHFCSVRDNGMIMNIDTFLARELLFKPFKL